MLVNKELIARILAAFMVIVQKEPNSFDPRDVEMVQNKTWWVERFALVNQNENNALKGLINSMKWRKSYGVRGFIYDFFPMELHDLGK